MTINICILFLYYDIYMMIIRFSLKGRQSTKEIVKFMMSNTNTKSPKITREMQIPQTITYSEFQDRILIETASYNFLMQKHPNKKQLFIHKSNTPAALLLHDYLHLLEPQIPKVNKDEKYNAYKKLLKEKYEKAFKSCKSGVDIFHLSRRINLEIREKQKMIGIIDYNNKYKQYPLWISYRQALGKKTLEEYQKNGVFIELLNTKIIPSKQIWMPTRQNYLELLKIYMNNTPHLDKIQNIADLGCGSGVLSFILSKKLKKNSKIIGLDINKNAVDTSNITATKLEINNFKALECNLLNLQNYENMIKIEHLPKNYDLIISNPPWIVAKKLGKQIGLEDGVYDDKQKFLNSAFKFTKKYLKPHGRFLLIYSTLSKQIGLTNKTIEDFCKEYNLIIKQCSEMPYTEKLQPRDQLNLFKQKAKINLYVISTV